MIGPIKIQKIVWLEKFRKIMSYVKYRSGYGYKNVTVYNIGNYENFEKCPQVKEEIEKLGYTITEEPQDYVSGYSRWNISW